MYKLLILTIVCINGCGRIETKERLKVLQTQEEYFYYKI